MHIVYGIAQYRRNRSIAQPKYNVYQIGTITVIFFYFAAMIRGRSQFAERFQKRVFLSPLLPPHQRVQLHPADAVEDILRHLGIGPLEV